MNNQYSIDYFIEFFMAIPDDQWLTGHIGYKALGSHCALGHCTQGKAALWEREPKAAALEIIIGGDLNDGVSSVAKINDGGDSRYQQPTPKARILAALMDAKAKAEAALDEYERRELKPISKPLTQPVEA